MTTTSIRRSFFFLLVALVTVTFFSLIGPFLLTTFWAVVLAVIFRNTYRRIRIKLRGRSSLAAMITTLVILFFVLIPLTLLTIALINQSVEVYTKIETGEINVSKAVDYLEERLPMVQEALAPFGLTADKLRESLSNIALSATQAIGNRALSYTQNIITFIVQFSLMLYLLFFFLRDGQTIMRHIINALPMGNRRERQLFTRFAVVSRATLKGTLIVAIIQGSIGGLLFAILGIPAALLWGVLMTLLSLLPVGGSGIVWIPTAIILFIQGAFAKAITLVIVGVLIIGLVDNLLRPILVGRDTQMPDYLVLLATIGGIAWFGLSGFILGPVIAALFLTVWEITGKEYGGREE